MILQCRCDICRTMHTLDIPTEDLLKWQSGMLIQDAMPYLEPEVRELLISGTCNTCLNELFPPEEV